eukprot:CAMPEP_0114539702 /NCGR_PEP_ID=MMETSP0114-20121206/378_1 /TAXON_ID=31324 /ORGANISM="Goniomonas sp, Strain m" /LENGTH=67 /DNA_ID=CAMNT_0001723821 /DNA_START=18 /DNA_END=221 /DNA_ORIENTATION=+
MMEVWVPNGEAASMGMVQPEGAQLYSTPKYNYGNRRTYRWPKTMPTSVGPFGKTVPFFYPPTWSPPN